MSKEKNYEEEVKSMTTEELHKEFSRWSGSTGARGINSYSNKMLSIITEEIHKRDTKGNKNLTNEISEFCKNNNGESDIFILDFSPNQKK